MTEQQQLVVLRLLAEHTAVSDAIPQIARFLSKKSSTVGHQLPAWFKAAGLGHPSAYTLGAVLRCRGKQVDSTYQRSLERRLVDRSLVGDRIFDALTTAFEAKPLRRPPPARARRRRRGPERLLTALWSDLHFGTHVDPREVPGNEYNWLIASRRMAKLCTQLAEWKPEHRSRTALQLVINGDVIAGRIHTDDAGIQRLSAQIEGAARILIACLDYLKHHFSDIRVLCLPGNHDRVTKLRQVSQRWDSHAHQVFLAMKMAFRNEPQIRFDVPLTGDGTYELPGGKALAYATHGDVAPTFSNVGRSLDVTKPLGEFYKLNASGEFKKPVRVMLYGHWHQPFAMPCGVGTVLVNGCVIGADAFARNGIGERAGGFPCQVMFESTADYEFGDSRFVYLRDADGNRAYDRVIRPQDVMPEAA